MLIAQISDTHIVEDGKLAYGVADTAKNLVRCVENINNLPLAPDLVIISGDITNDMSEVQAKRAFHILENLNVPYYLVPGNHDDRTALWNVFGEMAIPYMSDGFINYVIEGDFTLRIIGLDSLYPGHMGGEVCATRAAWLNKCLDEGGTQPTVIFMHHPPIKLGVPESDQGGFYNPEILGEIVSKYPNIERILCGHVHLETHSSWNGTIVTTAPSVGMQLTLDLTQANPSKFFLSNPAYLLHYLNPDNILVTHRVDLNDIGIPCSFNS